MKEVNAINFLLYSYFNLTLDDKKEDEILSAAIARAYRDASSRVLSITDETNSIKDENEKETPLLDLAKKFLNEQISCLISDNSLTSDYDKWFYDTCNKLKEIYSNAKNKKDESAFTFGHAQKWVNMTMKYLYVIKSIFKKYGTDVLTQLSSDLEKKLHFPVDGYIMQAAALSPENFSHGLGIKLPNGNGNLVSYSSSKAWSKWECKDYKSFRNQLKSSSLNCADASSDNSPLDWESSTWIEIAKIRKEKEKKK